MLRRNVFIAGVILVLGSIAVTASAQGPGGGMCGGMRGGGSSAMLLGIPEVQKELNLNDDQKKQIDTLLAEAVRRCGPRSGRSISRNCRT